MTALFIVVPLALLISGVAVYAFIWSVNHGQMDDLQTPALRMLEEDEGEKGSHGDRQIGDAPESNCRG